MSSKSWKQKKLPITLKESTLLDLSPTEVGITGKYELRRDWEWIKFPSGQKDWGNFEKITQP